MNRDAPAAGSAPGSAIDRMLAEARLTLPARPGAADLPTVRARGALIVDIRPVGLRQRDGALAGAVVVDRNQLEWRLDPTSPWRIPEVTGADQEIVLVCDEGYASTLAAATLHALGLRRATDLAGGYQAVRAAAVEAVQPVRAAAVEAAAVEAAAVEAAKVEAKVEAAKVEAAKVEADKVEAAKVEATEAGTFASCSLVPIS